MMAATIRLRGLSSIGYAMNAKPEPHVTQSILVLPSLPRPLFEIDGQGVVFNAHYLTYFDTTITEYFRALGYDQFADAKATGIDFHVVKSVIEYKAPVLFD